MKSTLKLVLPSKKYINEIVAYKNEFDNNESIHGSAGLSNFDDISDWLKKINDSRHGKNLEHNHVPSTCFLTIRVLDNKIIGSVDIRHYLNENLEKFGGHIGYAIRPSERKKGYATEQLRLALLKCLKMNVYKVLVTCNKSNVGSRKTILNNGGVFHSELMEGTEKNYNIVERYWIHLR